MRERGGSCSGSLLLLAVRLIPCAGIRETLETERFPPAMRRALFGRQRGYVRFCGDAL